MSSSVEVRVPTFRRPEMLKRALGSLQAQTCGDWAALVFDDSPDREAFRVVNEIADRRICVVANDVRLGAAANLDRAFQTRAYGDAEFAFVLEDDNWVLPTFIEENVRELRASGLAVLLRNQMVFDEATQIMAEQTTRGDLLIRERYEPAELHALLFFCEGVSNGGLFWRTGCRSDLQVGPGCTHPGLQEYCRTLQLEDSIQFAPECTAVWTRLPRHLTAQAETSNRIYARGVQAVRRFLLRKYGHGIVELAGQMAREAGKEDELRMAMIETGAPLSAPRTSDEVMRLGKAFLRLLLTRDPLSETLGKKRPLGDVSWTTPAV